MSNDERARARAWAKFGARACARQNLSAQCSFFQGARARA